MKQSKEWEKEFDDKFDKELFTPSGEEEIMVDVKPQKVKDFIQQLLQKEREQTLKEIIKQIEETNVGINASDDVLADLNSVVAFYRKVLISNIKKL